jgi:hypothetical protein
MQNGAFTGTHLRRTGKAFATAPSPVMSSSTSSANISRWGIWARRLVGMWPSGRASSDRR